MLKFYLEKKIWKIILCLNMFFVQLKLREKSQIDTYFETAGVLWYYPYVCAVCKNVYLNSLREKRLLVMQWSAGQPFFASCYIELYVEGIFFTLAVGKQWPKAWFIYTNNTYLILWSCIYYEIFGNWYELWKRGAYLFFYLVLKQRNIYVSCSREKKPVF